jgi:carboxylesterase
MGQVIEGAEAWSAPGRGENGAVGILVLHGFTGNPVSMRPLALALAGEGFAIEMPLLPGHGTDWRDLQRRSWREWAAEAGAALDRLAERTRARVAVGLSGGATLSLRLAQTRGQDLAGIALINPSVFSGDRRLKALPLLKRVLPSVPAIGNDIAKPGADERCYDRTPLRALASFVQLQREVRGTLPQVTCPTLVLTSRSDHVVEPENSQVVLDGIAATDTEHVWLERSYHVATLDHDAELIVERVTAFIHRVTGAAPPRATQARA